MSPTKIFIATATIFIVTSFLNGCAQEKTVTSEAVHPAASVEMLREIAPEIEKDVKLQLKGSRENGVVRVTVEIENPSQKSIASAQSWLSFDPAKLKGIDVDTSESSFELTAPYDNTFDNVNGVVYLGRATANASSDRFLTVAEVTFEVKKEGTTTINFFDYKPDVTGHTSVNRVVKGTPYNVLVEPETPALILQ